VQSSDIHTLPSGTPIVKARHFGDVVSNYVLHQRCAYPPFRLTFKAVQDKIEDLCIEFPEYTCLLSIPGFGPDISSKVLGAIGYPFRFTSSKQVLKMDGFDLCASRSGKTSNSATPVISKQGKADLRYALYQACLRVRASRRRSSLPSQIKIS